MAFCLTSPVEPSSVLDEEVWSAFGVAARLRPQVHKMGSRWKDGPGPDKQMPAPGTYEVLGFDCKPSTHCFEQLAFVCA